MMRDVAVSVIAGLIVVLLVAVVLYGWYVVTLARMGL